ncbi:MAG: 1-acyl-sn-glycerol-3-phosphate acyltransferase [Actinobacteria bacterium]|nr:1-acyl-sn-glycerol-3-phosphate acyltransferase [Actinomycetota bacterium]NBY14825.1 1-acyl-sn-glycerol-3-phosphate acyltransferase [Actinomycetota bacterium]
MSKTKPQSKPGAWYQVVKALLRPPLQLLTKRDWRGGENLQRPGGAILAMNHLSWFDPFAAAHFCNDQGRPVRFLAKAEIFKIPVIGKILKSAGQIPVHRGSVDAASSLHSAIAAVNQGECIIIYPEGTLTRDPNLWPMTAKNGVARIALATRAPVIPAAQWGPEKVLAPQGGKLPKFFPRKTMRILAGPPVDLSDLLDQPVTAENLKLATERIMAAITELLSELRNEPPPTTVFDRRVALNKKPSDEKGEA